MNDEMRLTEILERTANSHIVSGAPIVALRSSMSRRRAARKRAIAALTSIVMLASVGVLLLSSPWDRSGGEQVASSDPTAVAPSGKRSTTRNDDALTAGQYAASIEIARQQIANSGAEITSATSELIDGSLLDLEGSTCADGPFLRINLVGTFPGFVVSGVPADVGNDPEGKVRSVTVLADAETGERCQISMSFHPIEMGPNATQLDL